MLFPYTFDLQVQISIPSESISKRQNDTLKRFRVNLWFNCCMGIPDQVIVKFRSSWLLVLDDNLSDGQEEVGYSGVVIIELGGSVDST